MRKLTQEVALLCAALIALVIFAPLAALAENARYTLADDGAAVVDGKTGLVWKRCEEGKYFSNGACKGLGMTYTWSDVQRLASDKWRLPTADELASLKEDTGVAPPINREFFPNTDRAWFWTSSVDKRNAAGCKQSVFFGNEIPRNCPTIKSDNELLSLKPAYVRLVRVNQ